jgi:hypothetical protein
MLEVVTFLQPKAANVNDQIERMYNLEKELAMVQLDTDQKRNQTYENYTLAELNQVIPLVISLKTNLVLCFFFLTKNATFNSLIGSNLSEMACLVITHK